MTDANVDKYWEQYQDIIVKRSIIYSNMDIDESQQELPPTFTQWLAERLAEEERGCEQLRTELKSATTKVNQLYYACQDLERRLYGEPPPPTKHNDYNWLAKTHLSSIIKDKGRRV